MSSTGLERFKQIFSEAMEKPRADRRAFLEAACSDPAERAEIQALTEASEDAGDFLAAPTVADTTWQGFAPPGSDSAESGKTAEGRWPADTVLNGRYRIVALIGSGGMGEVYRADDLTLDQPVALKFLSRHLIAEPARLQGLYDEVRLGRRVSHPNVCRIYDIGEVADADGGSFAAETFISMEYVDGETLASLLRRMGRPPLDKALQIAHELCAGLAAVHDQGLLHRDLKPANIMIDGRGVTRLTDFGVAALAESADGLAGTPGYLSPEALNGRPITVASDIYTAGLVLFELFTGQATFSRDEVAAQAYRARAADLAQHRESWAVDLSRLTKLMDAIDPSVRRIVLRCVRPDPADRPPSVEAIIAALPKVHDRALLVRSLVVGLLVTLIVLIANAGGGLVGLEHTWYDLRARYFQFFLAPPPTQLVHLDIDDAALEEVGQWPWPRSLMARILDELRLAKPKIIGLDIFYSEPEAPRPEKQPDGSWKMVDPDRLLADAMERCGNVLVPVHIPLIVAPIHPPVYDKLVELLEVDPEQPLQQLVDCLKSAGLDTPDLAEEAGRQYPFALREAMFNRVDMALGSGAADDVLTSDALRQKILPAGYASGIKTAADHTLDRVLPQVLAQRDLERFTRPMDFALGSLLSGKAEAASTPTIAQAARYCGFVDYLPLEDGVVRSAPLWIHFRDRILPQEGLALACAYLDVDVRSIRIDAHHIVIPRNGGSDIVIPVHTVNSDDRGEMGMFMDIPYVGTGDWTTMYDFPDHRVSRQHLPITRVWDICEVSRRIEENNRLAYSDVEKVLQHSNIDSLHGFQASTQPSPDDAAAWNGLMGQTMEGVDPDTRHFLLDEHSNLQTDDERDYAAAVRNLHLRPALNDNLLAQRQQLRDALRQEIEGRALLIGSIASGHADMWQTPLHVACPGVVIHGAIFNAIISGQLLRTAPRWISNVAILVAGLSTTVVVIWLSPSKALIASLIAAAFYLAVNGLVFFDAFHTIVGAAGPIVAITSVALTGVFVRLTRRSTGRFRKVVPRGPLTRGA